MSRRSPYDVLQVQPNADADVIAVVYRHLAKRYHPDRDPSPDAEARMIELNEAYAILGDAEKRARYDEATGFGPRPAPDPGAREGVGGGASVSQARRGDPGFGQAGPPPASPPASGRLLTFGRYRGWALNQVQRRDPDYLEWLGRTPMGRTYRQELDELVRRRG